ncbi:hypothetical protein [Halarcobacter bivalviorum]|uniref:Uncharacterized protein n=1 Tax=Halarcobacter bivalviorum TaxID=663364 RepID=A0AAX2A9Z9_9BACT|nr:hypothetical protein [Halarcobacter bivalviorum]AXH11267.1 hypothetical protein ABIV_0228 [Halarcobacter bivalviorum]RXK09536.1 hypothetical protein CRV05_09510 [Halarcobacter bivalviorum]
MTLDLLIPFGILLILVIYLIYTRNKFEKNIVDMYEEKFEQWKENSQVNENNKKVCKELVGIIYKEEYNITVELIDESVRRNLQQGKYKIKDK